MKRAFLASVTIVALACPALAQTTTVITSSPPAASITIAPEERTRIKTYVIEKRVRPVVVKERIVVGGTLPADIELVEAPADWGPDMVRYRYVNWDNRVVLVEPSSRRVVQIID